MMHSNEKGQRYVQHLNSARVQGDWAVFPEAIRKLSKHAPERALLIATAKAEYAITLAAAPSAERPRSVPSEIEALKTAISNQQQGSADEIFQAQSCVAWISLVLPAIDSEGPVSSTNVADLYITFDQAQKGQDDDRSRWTRICLLRSSLIGSSTSRKSNDLPSGMTILSTSAAWIMLNRETVRNTPQMSYWAEQIIATYILSGHAQDALSRQFETWTYLIAKTREVRGDTYRNLQRHISRAAVWDRYYKAFSDSLGRSDLSIPRRQQIADLRTAEASYEGSFLSSRPFPSAADSNQPVEAWVERVIRNWQILCSADWNENDFGEGGKQAYSRSVLDILYRAAGKTFQSTLILRRLFQVHKALTEFDLAYSCLDTYIDLIKRIKARAAKAGEARHGGDPDEIVLLTVAEGIEGLCAYGKYQEAERAFNLALKMEEWLQEHMPADDEPELMTDGEPKITQPTRARPLTALSSDTVEIVLRSVGIAYAHWAGHTPFSERRSEFQAHAMALLQKAVSKPEPQLATIYPLALLAAETRNISLAVIWTKTALQSIGARSWAISIRQYSAFWHLLTLLLSAQQQFEVALQSASVALEQRPARQDQPQYLDRQTFLAEQSSGRNSSLPECDESQRVIELEITRLALIELTSDVEAALNHGSELMSLFTHLFGHLEISKRPDSVTSTIVQNRTMNGTARSIRSSMFSRKKVDDQFAPSTTSFAPSMVEQSPSLTRPTTTTSNAPAIQVTNEAGKTSEKTSHYHRHSKPNNKEVDLATAIEPKNEVVGTNLSTTDCIRGSTGGDLALNAGIDQEEKSTAARDNVKPPVIGRVSPQFSRTVRTYHASMILCNIWLVTAGLYGRAGLFEDAKEALEEANKVAGTIENMAIAADSTGRILSDAGWGGMGKSSDEVWADVYCAHAELKSAIVARKREDGLPVEDGEFTTIVDYYEQCLMFSPNHANGIIGLSKILLDHFEQIINLGRPTSRPARTSKIVTQQQHLRKDSDLEEGPVRDQNGAVTPSPTVIEHADNEAYLLSGRNEDLRKTPENLKRIAARDRAYGLLSALTKSGQGCDNSDAWFTLARAHELGGEIDKAKDILWWCTELEDSRPIRPWRNLSCNAYVL